ncbi:hypothetical protein AJ80_02253 [Polytolypa hystricis UAMH7299]|uniref:PH domain-containing protein n=1 Tax=Polytolypa hystricis (strain UAMH7299) TaxID=1447883 RepID=A0A2B7YSQ3_POLH7|nr:hypothetical protein AJ80_02253 [Polytolypa hystricis UAMH7299]
MANGQRPLSELSPAAQRRNSPSWNQSTRGSINGDSSPFDSSPFNTSQSPRLFWKGREASPFRSDSENKSPYEPDYSSSPSKRSSIENLKRASRVKNSSMFAREQKQEYDPSQVRVLERPLASGRPLSMQFQSSNNPGGPVDARRQLPSQFLQSLQNKDLGKAPAFTMSSPARPGSSLSTGSQSSPTKSSLSKRGQFGNRSSPFDPESQIWSDNEEAAHDQSQLTTRSRAHAKSVTFDAAPPQINEYEMTTPAPSSIASSREGSYDSAEFEDSFDHGIEDSFDASLEDTEKTPVVLPDEWRYMSPDSANSDMMNEEDDPFTNDYGSPAPDARPSPLRESQLSRVESLDSNGERRPLPPLPSSSAQPSPDQSSKLASTLERASSVQRTLPSPLRPASYSKADIGSGSMSLEDRLQLMMMQDQQRSPEAEAQRERRMRRAGAKDRSFDRDESKHPFEYEDESSFNLGSSPPQISRESILQNLRSHNHSFSDASDVSSQRSETPRYQLPLDPDVPIPSLEGGDEVEEEIVVKEENDQDDQEDQDLDLYAIPEYYSQNMDDSSIAGESEFDYAEDDNASHYSQALQDNEPSPFHEAHEASEDQSTPVPESTKDVQGLDSDANTHHLSISGLMENEHEFDVDLRSYIDQSSTIEERPMTAPHLSLTSFRNSLQRPETPEDQVDTLGEEPEEALTPQSVIHRPMDEELVEEEPLDVEELAEPPLNIPEPIATVRVPSGALQTRPSLTPADPASMAATRRKVSGQSTRVPSIPEMEHREAALEGVNDSDGSADEGSTGDTRLSTIGEAPQEKRLSSLVKLSIPVSASDEGLGFGLDQEFDRLIEAQKRGYLMRQNTKVVVASSRPEENPRGPVQGDSQASKSVPSSPRKASQQTWTTEPWSPSTRRQSIKVSGAFPKKKPVGGAVPPLPGQESIVKEPIIETSDANAEGLDFDDGEERGRLFVKVVGVRDLDLPLPRGERSYFALTLDNGLHCVTTAWLELGKSAPIGQEFELVVLNELEFQLTLQMKPDQLKPKTQPAPASVPAKSKSQKTSAFSRVFASPKKRKEMELRQQLEADQLKQKQAEERALAEKADPWEKLRTLVASDGSFARAYISLTDFESQAFGRPFTTFVTCFNEWAVDKTINNSKSKRNPAGSGTQLRPPYQVGSLELQLLYVPKPKGATDDDMPKSMNACIREMRDADNLTSRSWEGFLSQQGGDCPYWRRRFFKLRGTELTAFHQTTGQRRAIINLSKAKKLIDDRSTLTQKETTAKGGGRRKSAFAEEEDGYMFVEEGFRIRFANGEVIDFYADSAAEKDGWMNVLAETVGKGHSSGGKSKSWTELVFQHEKAQQKAQPANGGGAAPPPPRQAPPKPLVSAPSSPRKEGFTSMLPPPAPPAKSRHQHTRSEPVIGTPDQRRKMKSLKF